MNRGGSWNNNAGNCRAANRNNNTPSNRNDNIGFRLSSPGIGHMPGPQSGEHALPSRAKSLTIASMPEPSRGRDEDARRPGDAGTGHAPGRHDQGSRAVEGIVQRLRRHRRLGENRPAARTRTSIDVGYDATRMAAPVPVQRIAA